MTPEELAALAASARKMQDRHAMTIDPDTVLKLIQMLCAARQALEDAENRTVDHG